MTFQPSDYSSCGDCGSSYGGCGCGDYGALSTTVRTSQNGWPASKDPKAIGIVSMPVTLKKGTKNLQVAARAAGPLVAIVQWWDQNIEPVTMMGGYNYREIRGYEGTGKLSNHASGTAVDVNWDKHALGARGTVSAAQAAKITAKAASLGLIWGGNWVRRPDPMHFEVAKGGQAGAAASAALAAATSPTSPVTYLLLGGLGYWAWKRGYFSRIAARLRNPSDDEGPTWHKPSLWAYLVECAWCKKPFTLRWSEDPKMEAQVSHGMCPECYTEFLEKRRQKGRK